MHGQFARVQTPGSKLQTPGSRLQSLESPIPYAYVFTAKGLCQFQSLRFPEMSDLRANRVDPPAWLRGRDEGKMGKWENGATRVSNRSDERSDPIPSVQRTHPRPAFDVFMLVWILLFKCVCYLLYKLKLHATRKKPQLGGFSTACPKCKLQFGSCKLHHLGRVLRPHDCFVLSIDQPLLLPLASTRTHLSGTFVTQLILYRAPTPSPEHQLSNYSAIQEINYPLQPDTKLVNFGKTCAFIQFDSPSTQTSFRSLGVLLTY